MAEDRYKYFRVEARDILDQLGQGALDLEKGGAPAELVARLLRLAHTLKGAARVVKQREIADCSHALEDTLEPFREGSSQIPREPIDRVLSLVDQIGRHVALLTPQPAGAGTTSPANLPDQPVMTFRPAMDDLDTLLDGVFEAHTGLGALRPKLAQVESARQIASLVFDQLSGPRGAEARAAGSPIANEKARSMTDDLRGVVGTLGRDLTTSVDRLDRELRHVREAAERLRLTPANALFTFLERAVRDVATALGKRVAFEAHGGDVRADPVVLNVIQGALLHIVRNAAAHGIESEVERASARKPVEGRVTLRVSQRGRLVSFACTDDGRGIDLDAVRRIAQSKGLGPADSGTLGTEELLRVLLKGGISTSSTVTAVSGRGIGLDVVREAVERLGGEVTARTEKGQGTTIELVVPLSIVSFQTLAVEVEGGTVAIPLDAVRGTLRVTRADVIRTEQQEAILFDGQAIPLLSLQQAVFATAEAARPASFLSVVVVKGQAGTAAFSVNRMLGTAPIVMRPLPPLAPATGVVAGAALDSVGDPQLILDPDSLVTVAQGSGATIVEAAPSRLPVLVVDDSLTTRMLERSILESAGYAVELATSGEEGLEKARAGQYALFLVDVEMPGMDGFTFVERIRADPHLHKVPAILVTSRNAPEDLQRGRDAGAQAYMVKSEFDQVALLERIRALVG